LFGADRIHSMVRARIFKPDPPRYSGNMAWRALVPGDLARELGIERASHVWMGQGASMVIYYVSGGRLLNWVGVCRAERAPEESWTARGETRDALRDYEGWHPEIHTLIEAAGSPLKWAIHDRDPLQAWTAGRIALLGDAAHSMLPFHAQGAAQGIEDAWVLARCLEIEGDHEAAFARYESLRIGRANHVQEMSRAVERVVQADGADAIKRRDRRFREQHAKHQDGFTPGQKWLYAYDAERAVLGEAMDWADANW